MLNVSEAKEIIRSTCSPLSPTLVPLSEASGMAISEDIAAPINLPPFHQSGMDGYAFRFDEYNSAKGMPVTQIVQAGNQAGLALNSGEAARIFTGAPLPAHADTVVMQEHAHIEDGNLFMEILPARGANVRLSGSEVCKGAIAMQKGTYLSPSAIGFLAGMGISMVPVSSKAVITILITGDELQQPGLELESGQVYESSSYSLKAALRNLPVELRDCTYVKDDPRLLLDALNSALSVSDIVLLTGGVSVGDFDFVSAASEKAGVTKLFHRVKQKPGKPLYFGRHDGKLVFGLPGNPSSVLTCFYQYVLPAIEQLSGRSPAERVVRVSIASPYKKPAGITHFLKGRYENGTAYPLNAQESFRLSSFAQANCLIIADEETERYEAGDPIEIYLLPP